MQGYQDCFVITSIATGALEPSKGDSLGSNSFDEASNGSQILYGSLLIGWLLERLFQRFCKYNVPDDIRCNHYLVVGKSKN
jgi:hypothetical protein